MRVHLLIHCTKLIVPSPFTHRFHSVCEIPVLSVTLRKILCSLRPTGRIHQYVSSSATRLVRGRSGGSTEILRFIASYTSYDEYHDPTGNNIETAPTDTAVPDTATDTVPRRYQLDSDLLSRRGNRRFASTLY